MERLTGFGPLQFRNYSLTSLAEGSEPISEAEEIKEVKSLQARGVQAAKFGDFKEALKLFNEALEISDKDTAVLHARALVFLQTGNFSAALQDAKHIISGEPQDSQGYILQGLAFQHMGKLQEALTSLMTALSLDVDNADKLTNHVVSAVSKFCQIPKDLTKRLKAMDAYNKLSEVGVILYQEGQYEMCILVLEAAQRFQTNQKGITMRILLTLANAKSKLGLWQQAIILYQECLTVAMSTHEQLYQAKALVNIASLQLESGDTYQAIVYYRKLLSLEAELLSEAGNMDAMPEFWTKELQRGLHLNLSIAYKTIGNMSSAIIHARQYMKLVQMHGVGGRLQAESYHNIGMLHEILGDLPAALECYEEYLKFSRANGDSRGVAQAYGCLGGVHAILRNCVLSVTYHQQHTAMAEKLGDPKMVAIANEMLGDTYMLNGEYEKAVGQYETVANTCSHSDFRTKATILCKIGRGYRALGRSQHGLFCFEQALVLADGHDLADVRMLAQHHQACILCSSTQLQDIEQAQRSFVELIPFLEKKISEHEEEKSLCPREYHEQLAECYDGMQSVLSKLGNKEECLQYAEAYRKTSITQLPNYRDTCKKVAHYKEIQHVWTMERIHRAVSQQSNTVIFYSLLENALLLWVLQPGVGLVRFYSRHSPKFCSMRQQVNNLLDELLEQRRQPDHLTKCENRALPLRNSTLSYLQKQNLQRQQGAKVDVTTEPESAQKKSPQRQLYEILLAPVEDILLKIEEPRYLTIIPDKELHHCPFAVLQDWQGAYVGRRFNLSYMPSILLLDQVVQNEQTVMRMHDDLDFERSLSRKGGLQRLTTHPGISSSSSPVLDISIETQSSSGGVNLRQVSNPRLFTSGALSAHNRSKSGIPTTSRETTHLSLLSTSHSLFELEKSRSNHLSHLLPGILETAHSTEKSHVPGVPTAPTKMLSAHTFSTLTTRTWTGTDITTSTQVVTTFKQLSDRDKCVVFGAPSLPDSLLIYGRPWKTGGDLAVAKRELRMVGAMLDADPLIGDEATRERFLKEIQAATIIHIATFGCLEEGMLIVTSDPSVGEVKGEETSHMVTAEDILNCTLHAQLVVISAGFSPMRNNFTDNHFHLPSVFLAAGAQSVLVCQWQVPDIAVEKFFYCFYRHLQSDGRVLSGLASATDELQNDERFKSLWVWGAFVVIGKDSQVRLKQLQHAMLDQQIDRVEQEVEESSTKELLNPKSPIPHVASKVENFEKLQQYLVDLMKQHHRQPQVIPSLIDMVDAALKRLHIEDNNRVTAQLTTEVSGSMPAIQLMKQLGFHFQARGSHLTIPYVIFPHWNTDDLLIPAYDSLQAVADLTADTRMVKALCECFPLSQENISLMIDLLSITKHATEVQLKVSDLSVRPLWHMSHLRQLLSTAGFHQIGLLLAFDTTPKNKQALASLLQLLLAVSCYKSPTLLYRLDVDLLGHESASQPSSISAEFAKLPSLTPLILPRNQLRMSTPWLSTAEHQDEMLEKLRLAKSKSDLSDTLHRQLEHAKSWHQNTVTAQANEALNKYGRPKTSPSKVKVMPGSTASQKRVPVTRERVLRFQDIDQRRDYAHHVLHERLGDIGSRYREHVMKLFLPYIKA